jgi:hypothetical protein
MVTITESQWVNNFGFQRFPFDRPEAGNEEFARPDFLASCCRTSGLKGYCR